MRYPLLVVLAALLVAGCAAGRAGGSGRTVGATRGPSAPSTPTTASPSGPDVHDLLARMTVPEKVGQLFVTTVTGTTAADGGRLIAAYHVGGVIYFADNLHDPAQVARLSRDLQRSALRQRIRIPLLIGVDQEQGPVARLGSLATRFPPAMAVGATGDPEFAATVASMTGAELAALGINLDYAPVADVNVNPRNPVIGVRAYGADPGLVSRMVAAAVSGFHSAGVAAVAKHFPGHGDTDVDSHTGLPLISHSRATWERVDAPPFRAAIAQQVDAIMTAHVAVPALDSSGTPATLSRPVITGLLRGELGYDGVVTTDSLQMAGVRQRYGDAEVAVRAIEAGADQLLMPPSLDVAYRAVLTAVRAGRISERRLDQSVTRILRLKQRRGLLAADPAPDPSAVAGRLRTPAASAAARRLAEAAVTLVRDRAGLLPLGRRRVLVTGYGADRLGAFLRDDAVGRVTTLPTGTAPPASVVQQAVARAAGVDVVVVTTRDVRLAPAQRALVARLVASGRPVVAVALGEPYDLAYLPPVAAYLATYWEEDDALFAVAKVLAGRIPPRGRLSVPVA